MSVERNQNEFSSVHKSHIIASKPQKQFDRTVRFEDSKHHSRQASELDQYLENKKKLLEILESPEQNQIFKDSTLDFDTELSKDLEDTERNQMTTKSHSNINAETSYEYNRPLSPKSTSLIQPSPEKTNHNCCKEPELHPKANIVSLESQKPVQVLYLQPYDSVPQAKYLKLQAQSKKLALLALQRMY